MPDYYGGVAQAGAQMMNSGLNAMAAQRKLEAEKEMQSQKIAAGERMQAARISAAGGGGAFNGNDPVSKGARSFTAITSALNAHSDEQINLMGEVSKLDKAIQDRGYGTDEDNIAKQRLQARLQNNDYAMKMMTKSLGGGKFEYNTTDADGSTVKAVFDSAADLEAYKSMFKGNAPEAVAEKNNSLLTNIFGSQKTAPRAADSADSDPMRTEPVPRAKAPTMDEQVNSMLDERGVDQSEQPKNPAATGGGGGRRGRTEADIDNERKLKIASLEKELDGMKNQKNSRGNQNTAAMRDIAAKIIEEKKKLKSGN
jgi:hypothetical protein